MVRNLRKYTTARKLRSSGWSYTEIGRHLNVAKSTLNGWLNDVPLSYAQRQRLKQKWETGLTKARTRAAEVHHQETRERFAQAYRNAERTIAATSKLINQSALLRLALALLYLGEGTKNKSLVCLANSNPDICRVFVELLRRTYTINETKFRCHLHLRVDQNDQKEIRFWSKQLHIPGKKFLKSQRDQRSLGKPTVTGYHGVCAVYYYDATIQKDILMLGQAFLNRTLKGN